jgi:hypothetical protein
MRRKILMGVFALALPAGTLGLAQSAAFAKAPPNPVTCNLAATINLSVPLSPAGVLSSKGATSTTTVTVTYSGCHDAAGSVPGGSQSLSISTPAAKPSAEAQAAGDSKKNVYLGDCGAFTSSGTTKNISKSLKNLNIAVGGEVLKGPKAAEGAIGGEVGFTITGTAKGGTYPTAGKGASLAVALLNDANNTNLIGGCHSGSVDHLDVDNSTSTGTF